MNTEKLIDAIRSPITIKTGKYNWTFTDFNIWDDEQHNFVYANLTKYMDIGEVNVLDDKNKIGVAQPAPNLIVSSSPFVYLPNHSGIAYLRVWNEIEQPTFVKRFTTLIEEKYNRFFLKCEIDPISDLVAFYKKVSELNEIKRISGNVRPPNPLFGVLWKDLKKYLENRNAKEVRYDEKANGNDGLKTELITAIKAIIEENEALIKNVNLQIGDQIILMAADGYGKGKIEGVKNNKNLLIRTNETMKSFAFDKEPDPIALYDTVDKLLDGINKERHMEH